MKRGRVLVVEERASAETSGLWDRVREEGYGVTVTALDGTAKAVRRAGTGRPGGDA